jgi:hypothetical protein
MLYFHLYDCFSSIVHHAWALKNSFTIFYKRIKIGGKMLVHVMQF